MAADTPAPQPSATVVAARADAPDSPRACIAEYLDLARRGRYTDAARYLWLTSEQESRAAELARRLKAVLDRQLWIDLDRLSPGPEGDASDGLAPNTDSVGSIVGQPVLVVRTPGAGAPAWKFAPSTVARIDRWYGELSDRWIRDRAPDFLLRPGPRELLWWQWLALPLLVALAWLVARPLVLLTRAILTRVFAKTENAFDDQLLTKIGGPLSLAWTLAVIALLLPWLALYTPAAAFVRGVLRAASLVTLFWALWRTVHILGTLVGLASWVRESASAASLLALAVRAGKIGVLAVGLVSVLSQLGYPVAGLIAGLGVGGLALALAAQKTVEHLFGSISLAIDQPFRLGDFVKVDDFVGNVEAIGLRSTRIRTLDRTIITIPNGKLADMKIESFAVRDRMRLACTIALVYATTPGQMQAVLAGLEKTLRDHPKIWPDVVVVRLKELAASSLDIEVMAWFDTREWSEFQLFRQEILLGFMQVVESAGTSFAFPTRTVHVVESAGEASSSV